MDRYKYDIYMLQSESPLLIIGSPRSGTTWLAEIINHTQNYRYLFEPFHAGQASCWKGAGFYPVIADKEVEKNTYRVHLLKKILSGEIDSSDKWVFGHGLQHQGAEKIMIKAIRAQFMLSAIQNISPSIKIIFLVRNPVDTVSSQMRSNFPEPKNILSADGKLSFVKKEALEKYIRICGEQDLSLRVLKWAIENKAVQDFVYGKNNTLTISYEKLISFPGQSISEILDFLDITSGAESIIEKSTRPSSTANLSSKSIVTDEQLEKLKKCSDIACELFNL